MSDKLNSRIMTLVLENLLRPVSIMIVKWAIDRPCPMILYGAKCNKHCHNACKGQISEHQLNTGLHEYTLCRLVLRLRICYGSAQNSIQYSMPLRLNTFDQSINQSINQLINLMSIAGVSPHTICSVTPITRIGERRNGYSGGGIAYFCLFSDSVICV